jgi:hypothetical protein
VVVMVARVAVAAEVAVASEGDTSSSRRFLILSPMSSTEVMASEGTNGW